jgi:hypothetical protein
MKINGVQYRLLKKGAIVRKTDVFSNGHEVESYNIGTRNTDEKPFYRLYRKINKPIKSE